MARILLVLFTLQLTPAFAWNNGVRSAVANARSREGGMAVAYVANRAREKAESIKRPTQLSEDRMDNQEFYSVFVSYGAYQFLKPEILGSWEFADRIENLGDWADGAEDVRIAAGRARMGTKVKYTPPPLPETIDWLDDLTGGYIVKSAKIDIDLDVVVKSLYSAGLDSLTVRHDRGHFDYNSDFDDDVWIEDKFVTEGTLHPGETRRPFRSLNNLHQYLILSDFTTRLRPNGRIVDKSVEDSRLTLPYSDVTSIQLNSHLTSNTVRKRLLEALAKNGFSMRKLQKAVPRILGKRPVCETDVE